MLNVGTYIPVPMDGMGVREAEETFVLRLFWGSFSGGEMGFCCLHTVDGQNPANQFIW